MLPIRIVAPLILVSGWLLRATTLLAQVDELGLTGQQAAVSGTGTVVLKRSPETLRMYVDVQAKGKTLKEALDKLKERREAAEKRVAELGAASDTIKAETAKIPPVDPNRQRQMEMMVRERMRERGKRTAKKPEAAKPVTVTCTLTADFPLKSDGGDSLLLAANALEEKVRKADLAGGKEKDELSPEEEELAEEMSVAYDDSGSAKPGEPRFLFVAKIPADERSKALASAFKKARQQAEQTSAAAGAKLGDLRRLTGNVGLASEMDNMYGYAQQNYGARYRMLQAMQAAAGGDSDESEAVGQTAGDVRATFTVMAEFSLK